MWGRWLIPRRQIRAQSFGGLSWSSLYATVCPFACLCIKNLRGRFTRVNLLRSVLLWPTFGPWLSFGEGRIERPGRRLEVDVFDELTGLASASFAIHAAVFPFDGQRSLVPSVVEGANELFEL